MMSPSFEMRKALIDTNLFEYGLRWLIVTASRESPNTFSGSSLQNGYVVD
jgi:hypothetical protein